MQPINVHVHQISIVCLAIAIPIWLANHLVHLITLGVIILVIVSVTLILSVTLISVWVILVMIIHAKKQCIKLDICLIHVLAIIAWNVLHQIVQVIYVHQFLQLPVRLVIILMVLKGFMKLGVIVIILLIKLHKIIVA